MDRQARIDEVIAACTECGGRDFPMRPDCDGCINAVDDEIASELAGWADRISAITREIARSF